MLIKIGLENGFEGKSVAWVLDHPGCFAYGNEGSDAILKIPQVIVSYQNWMREHTPNSWLINLGDFDVRLVQVLDWNATNEEPIPGTTEKPQNDWFLNDALPLTQKDVSHGLLLLAWARTDLLNLVSTLSDYELSRGFTDERWSIRGILDGIADTEYWTLERLGLTEFQHERLSEDTFIRLIEVRQQMNVALPELIGRDEVRNVDGELWSGRKILRRAAWFEKDRIQQILRLLTLL
jgi:hypothetical protein